METVVIRKAVLNTVGASGANVKNDAASGAYPGACIVCADNTANPLLNILPPIFKGTCKSAVKQAAVAEVKQIVFGGRAAETIVASKRYKIQIGNGDTYEGQKQEHFSYAYTAPAVLSGNADTDRHNVFTVLAGKINNHSINFVTAYVVYKVAFTTGSTALPVVGETVTQLTSNVTAKIAAVEVTTGNFTGTTAEGFIYLYDFSAVGSWSTASKTLTGTSTAVVTTNAALTPGAGIVIVDDGSYYGPRPNSKRGPSFVDLTEGWVTAQLETYENQTASVLVGTAGPYVLVGKAAVISQGIGSRLVLDTPVLTPDGTVLVSGDASAETNEAFNAAKNYTTVFIEVDAKTVSDTNISGYTKGAPVWYVIYADESNSTNLTNFLTDLETALGVTIA